MSLDRSEGTNLINIQYGVAFGAIFSFCFDHVPGSSTIRIAITPCNILPFLGLIIYFLLDWLTANFARTKYKFEDWVIYLWSLAIWYLGSLVVLMNSEDNLGYMGLSLYLIVAGLFDVFGYRNKFYTLANIRSLLWMNLAGMKIIVGLIVFLQAIVVVYGGANTSLKFIATILIFVVSGMKMLRYYLLIKDKNGESGKDE